MSTRPSYALKLERAREHLDTFEREAGRWVQSEPYGIVDEPDPEPPLKPVPDVCVRRRLRITRVCAVPQELSLPLGDCVFNLRAALDHLALSLARSHTATLTDRQISGSEFPVFHAAPMDAKTECKKIGCVAPDAALAIKGMQPHHRGADYTSDPLWQIHELNRIDKHRELTFCAAAPIRRGVVAVGFPLDWVENLGQITYWQNGACDLKLDAVFSRWAAIPNDPNREVRMHPFLPLEVVFGDGSPMARQPVGPTLRALCDHVGNVIVPALSKFL